MAVFKLFVILNNEKLTTDAFMHDWVIC